MTVRFEITGWVDVSDEFADYQEQQRFSQANNMENAINLMEGFEGIHIEMNRTSPTP